MSASGLCGVYSYLVSALVDRFRPRCITEIAAVQQTHPECKHHDMDALPPLLYAGDLGVLLDGVEFNASLLISGIFRLSTRQGELFIQCHLDPAATDLTRGRRTRPLIPVGERVSKPSYPRTRT